MKSGCKMTRNWSRPGASNQRYRHRKFTQKPVPNSKLLVWGMKMQLPK